jgi:hypothetical protein
VIQRGYKLADSVAGVDIDKSTPSAIRTGSAVTNALAQPHVGIPRTWMS